MDCRCVMRRRGRLYLYAGNLGWCLNGWAECYSMDETKVCVFIGGLSVFLWMKLKCVSLWVG